MQPCHIHNGTASGFGELLTVPYLHSCAPIQVTGANQGIGLEIVRQLCKRFEGKVILSGVKPCNPS